MDGCGTENHERVGADFLRNLGFSERIAWLVEQHVNAKRYLCAVDDDYHAKLSDASRTTLKFQGGPMSAQEATFAAGDPRWPDVLALREFDEAGKESHAATRLGVDGLESFAGLLRAHVTQQATYGYVLSSEQRRKWTEDGAVLLRGAVPPSTNAHLSTMADELIALQGHGIYL
jgi:hypothetical protein